ncbi:MAG: hypothetical protein Q8R92_00780 [Deltaproteobacteria bacterium]|nr:hypothetical protein [Deltaproteobacteria bacterium]
MEDPEHVFHLNSLLAAVLACLVLQFAIGPLYRGGHPGLSGDRRGFTQRMAALILSPCLRSP